jgi:hypothetical protein
MKRSIHLHVGMQITWVLISTIHDATKIKSTAKEYQTLASICQLKDITTKCPYKNGWILPLSIWMVYKKKGRSYKLEGTLHMLNRLDYNFLRANCWLPEHEQFQGVQVKLSNTPRCDMVPTVFSSKKQTNKNSLVIWMFSAWKTSPWPTQDRSSYI